jgi:hypothetical protein
MSQMIKNKPKETQFEEIAKQAASGKDAPDKGGLAGKNKPEPAHVKPELKQDAAKKVFQEGVTGKDHGAGEAMEKLPHMNVSAAEK